MSLQPAVEPVAEATVPTRQVNSPASAVVDVDVTEVLELDELDELASCVASTSWQGSSRAATIKRDGIPLQLAIACLYVEPR
mmetsp:Transcript_4664/g.11321  ORF Transcript_4664/g.11321 Transcript_4664/m.11321 type:complete len:82 (+) Transcript_4664:558-803(+)|eukprot:5496327-Amphidinium_carterae.2